MISNELLNFIVDFFDKRKIMINEDLINSNTEVYNDLGFDVSDLDIDVFMAEFLKKFGIDDSNFDRKKYFGTGMSIVDDNVKFIKGIVGERKWLSLEKEKREPFTFGILDKAIKTKQQYNGRFCIIINWI